MSGGAASTQCCDARQAAGGLLGGPGAVPRRDRGHRAARRPRSRRGAAGGAVAGPRGRAAADRGARRRGRQPALRRARAGRVARPGRRSARGQRARRGDARPPRPDRRRRARPAARAARRRRRHPPLRAGRARQGAALGPRRAAARGRARRAARPAVGLRPRARDRRARRRRRGRDLRDAAGAPVSEANLPVSEANPPVSEANLPYRRALRASPRMVAAAIVVGALVAPAGARPGTVDRRAVKLRAATTTVASARDPKKLGASAGVVSFGRTGDLRPASDQTGRRAEPLTAEEETAAKIQKLLRGPLRRGVTGLFVADARTGEPLFAVNADDPLNPASNVKLISTATSLELLGPEFRYPTRLLGPSPVDGVVHGDVYLLGSHDPTLTIADLDDIAGVMVARGITSVTGRIVTGGDPTRDGVYRAVIPISLTAGEPGAPPTATVPSGFDFV